MFAAGAGWTPATNTARDHTRTSEGDGSPTSPAAAAAAAEGVAAEAAEEAAPTTTTTRASLLCVHSNLLYIFVVVDFLKILVCAKKKVKNP